MSKPLVLGFDLGTGSVGFCLRKDNQILALESLEIPTEHADYVQIFSERKRQERTKKSHKKREQWLIDYWTNNLKLEKPENIKEFNNKNNPILLRIKLLMAEQLSQEEVFACLFSIMQHRGYDGWDWRNKQQQDEKEEDTQREEELTEEEKQQREKSKDTWDRFKEQVQDQQYYYPAFYEAVQLKFFNPDTHIIERTKIKHDAEKARGITYERSVLVDEVR